MVRESLISITISVIQYYISNKQMERNSFTHNHKPMKNLKDGIDILKYFTQHYIPVCTFTFQSAKLATDNCYFFHLTNFQ